jgi:uncharacterized protein (DUF427 family)
MADETAIGERYRLLDAQGALNERTRRLWAAAEARSAWKGTASYYDIAIDDQTNPGAAWYYPEPMDAAAAIKDYVAFWRGVEVTSA